MHLNAEPQPLRAIAADARIPGALERVVLRALAKRPEERFQSARELRQALEIAARVRDGEVSISGTEKTIFAGSRESARPSRWIRLATIAAAMAMLVGDHVRIGAPNSPRRTTSSEAGESLRRPRAPAGADEAPSMRERSRRASLAAVRPSSARAKQNNRQPQPRRRRRLSRARVWRLIEAHRSTSFDEQSRQARSGASSPQSATFTLQCRWDRGGK